MTAAQRVQVETLKLLLQVVFSDRQAQDGEVSFMLSLASSVDTPEEFRAELPALLRGERPLPVPDLGLLRAHRGGVVAMAAILARADGVATPEEKQLVDTVEALLRD